MPSKYETRGGYVTRGETFSRLLDLTDQLADQTIVMSHLHQTEDTPRDRALAEGWRAMHLVMQMMRQRLIGLAQGNLQ